MGAPAAARGATTVGLAATGLWSRLAPLTVGAGPTPPFLRSALCFFALQSAPPAEAGLVAHLWPLLIVPLSSLLPGWRLRALHLAGRRWVSRGRRC